MSRKTNQALPLVSVVVTTKNEERNIGNCLESIKRQTYPQERIEIIVVDNNSTDRTKEIARKYTRKVYNKGPERSAQRNFGMIEKARGKYVMYLDADMILSRTVIEKAVEKLETNRNRLREISSSSPREIEKLASRNSSRRYVGTEISSPSANEIEKLVALYIPEVVLGNSFWSRVRRFERSFYDGTVIDCVRIIKKDVFKRVGGFDLSMTGPEDWDLDKKIRQVGKMTVVGNYDFEKIHRKLVSLKWEISPDWRRDEIRSAEIEKLINLTRAPVIFHNEAEFNWRRYLAKKSYYAKSFQRYQEKWGRDDPDVRKQFSFWYRYFGVFLENGKWRRFLRHPVLAAGVLLLRAAVGAVYLKEKIVTLLKF